MDKKIVKEDDFKFLKKKRKKNKKAQVVVYYIKSPRVLNLLNYLNIHSCNIRLTQKKAKILLT